MIVNWLAWTRPGLAVLDALLALGRWGWAGIMAAGWMLHLAGLYGPASEVYRCADRFGAWRHRLFLRVMDAA